MACQTSDDSRRAGSFGTLAAEGLAACDVADSRIDAEVGDVLFFVGPFDTGL